MDKPIYYLTGMGGRLNEGLGKGLKDKSFTVYGRELVGEFRNMNFQQRINLVKDDLQSAFWTKDSKVIANSFGAYLFLHTQAEMSPYPGRVILLSPIVGKFSNSGMRIGFIPPRARILGNLVADGKFPIPLNCQIHVGSDDWQSNPENVADFGKSIGVEVSIVPNAGHILPIRYVGSLLDELLMSN